MTRHLAIGDIHGCFVSFKSLIELVNVREDDVIITLGDYCNRGPNTCAVIDLLIDLHSKGNLRPLRGNHEIMMLSLRDEDSVGVDEAYEKWKDVGGSATLESYAPFEGSPGKLCDIPESHWDFLESQLLPFFETETHIFVHANAFPNLPLNDQPDFMLYWEQFNDPPMHESGKIMVCGHTSQKSGKPLTNGNAVCIDTWACGSGWLTCLDTGTGKVWQTNEMGESREKWLDEF